MMVLVSLVAALQTAVPAQGTGVRGLSSAPSLTRASCEALTGFNIAAGKVRLPTRGGVVTAASLLPADASPATAHPEYCLVSGKIAPVDTTAPNILFQVALPVAWNGKIVMFGGAGFDGAIPKIASRTGTLAGPTPLERGYAVFGSDSGHQASGTDLSSQGRFALNDEAYRNFAGEALKKTRDVAVAIITTAYRRGPGKSYFLGGSKGGAEGIYLASRWPADWDGIVANYPARSTSIALGMLALTRTFRGPAAWPSPQQRVLLHRAALESCDKLDGAADGLIEDQSACRAAFDPARATIDGSPLRCPDDSEKSETCLSGVQLTAFKAADAPAPFGLVLADGQSSFPGYNILTAVSGLPPSGPLQAQVTVLGLGYQPPGFPATQKMPLASMFVDNYFRYIVTQKPDLDMSQVDMSTMASYRARLKQVSAADALDLRLGEFQARRGKLMMMHGTDDLLISPRATEVYYNRLKTSLGERKVGSFVRFYEIAGMGHGVSTVFQASWDYLGALEAWVEKGIDPADNLVVSDTVGVPGRTRPMCRFPSWPKYRGTGDINVAASFTCEK